jgi:hypothetical protein
MRGRDVLGNYASEAGYEALRLSVHGAKALFGSRAECLIFVNKVSVAEAQRRAGSLPPEVMWRAAEPNVPDFLRAHLDPGMAEGVAWKFAPLRAFPGRHHCRARARGGIGPDFDFEAALKAVLRRKPVLLESELDEQGLQIAALSLQKPPLVVGLEEVTICSPFYPHLPYLGRCGAHFVGINVRNIPWSYYGQPATELRLKHWRDNRAELYRRVGLEAEAGLQEVA